MDELCIEVDEQDNRIGLRPKSDFHSGKYIHRSAHLILLNSRGEMLLQKRASTKRWYPDLYTYSVSATVADETYEECIVRETAEEIGIRTSVSFLFVYPHFDEVDKAFKAVFLARSDADITPDTAEIQSIRWIALEDLKKDIEDNSFKYTPPFLKGMRMYFEKIRQP